MRNFFCVCVCVCVCATRSGGKPLFPTRDRASRTTGVLISVKQKPPN